MPASRLFEVTFLRGSKTERLTLQSTSADQARSAASRHGRVLSVRVIRSPLFASKLSLADRAIFLQRLASMIASRVGMSDALRIIRDSFSGTIHEVSTVLVQAFENGNSKSLPDAMEAAGPRYFPETTVALVRTGSQGGNIAHALREAVRFEVEMSNVRKESRRGLWSAAIGFVIGVITLFGSTLYVGPMMMDFELFQMAKESVDIDWVMEMSSWLNWTVGLVLAVVLSSFALLSIVRPAIPSFVDRVVMRIPFYRDLVLSRQNYMTFFGFSILLGSGVRLEECMRLTRDSAPRGELRDDLERARKAIVDGRPWPLQMRMLHPTDRAALSMAEDRQQIATTVGELAHQYRDLYRQRLAVFVPIVQVLAAVFLSLAGVVLFGVAILPLLQISAGLLQQI
jgi:general secretion pathway protein F